MKKKRRPAKREFIDINGYLVFEHRAYFSDYLETEVGAKWGIIKRSLFDAGYTVTEVNDYRDRLLDDFNALCNEYHFTSII